MSDTEVIDLFQDDPMSQPLTYPGRIPSMSGVLVDDVYIALHAVEGERPDVWHTTVEGQRETLDELLSRLECPPMEARKPVVAVGSNASPSQMRRKFLNHSIRAVIPMTLADVRGIVAGVSAHVNKRGYVPAAPIEVAGANSKLFVLWLDDKELATLDLTEPNYVRRVMPEERHPVVLESGVRLPWCFIYVGKHGCLTDGDGRPRRLTDQRTLIRSLLHDSPRLRALCGDTPDEFVMRTRGEVTREAVYGVFASGDFSARQLGLSALPLGASSDCVPGVPGVPE